MYLKETVYGGRDIEGVPFGHHTNKDITGFS